MRCAKDALNNSTSSFRRTPESRVFNRLDTGVRRHGGLNQSFPKSLSRTPPCSIEDISLKLIGNTMNNLCNKLR